MSSDQYYAQQAARRQRMLILAGLLLAALICALIGARNAFYDRCTQSNDRAAESVVRAYLAAIGAGDASRVQDCWDRQQYYELKAGCSEICLSRLLGVPFQVTDVQLSAPFAAENARDRRRATVSVRCPSGESASGEILLDSIAADVPWKHWRVLQSSVGGSPAARWCAP